MNYDNITEQEARSELLSREEVDDDLYDELETQIIEGGEVLYWLDAFGDFEMAIAAQGLPKDLPDAVVEEITVYDVQGGWQGQVNEIECPVCETDLYEFDWKHDYIYLDEWGGTHSQSIWYLMEPDGYYWDTSGKHRVMCGTCANRRETFSRNMDDHYGVKIYYGDHDSWYPFSYEGPVVRWDGEWFMDSKNCEPLNIVGMNGEVFNPREIAKAFAINDTSRHDFIADMGWTKMKPVDVDVTTSGIRKTKRYVHEVLEKWATTEATTHEPTHPDFGFPYIIEDGRTIYFPSHAWETVKYHLEDQVLFEANEVEKLQKHRAGGVGA